MNTDAQSANRSSPRSVAASAARGTNGSEHETAREDAFDPRVGGLVEPPYTFRCGYDGERWLEKGGARAEVETDPSASSGRPRGAETEVWNYFRANGVRRHEAFASCPDGIDLDTPARVRGEGRYAHESACSAEIGSHADGVEGRPQRRQG